MGSYSNQNFLNLVDSRPNIGIYIGILDYRLPIKPSNVGGSAGTISMFPKIIAYSSTIPPLLHHPQINLKWFAFIPATRSLTLLHIYPSKHNQLQYAAS